MPSHFSSSILAVTVLVLYAAIIATVTGLDGCTKDGAACVPLPHGPCYSGVCLGGVCYRSTNDPDDYFEDGTACLAQGAAPGRCLSGTCAMAQLTTVCKGRESGSPCDSGILCYRGVCHDSVCYTGAPHDEGTGCGGLLYGEPVGQCLADTSGAMVCKAPQGTTTLSSLPSTLITTTMAKLTGKAREAHSTQASRHTNESPDPTVVPPPTNFAPFSLQLLLQRQPPGVPVLVIESVLSLTSTYGANGANGFLADPSAQTSLKNAITSVVIAIAPGPPQGVTVELLSAVPSANIPGTFKLQYALVQRDPAPRAEQILKSGLRSSITMYSNFVKYPALKSSILSVTTESLTIQLLGGGTTNTPGYAQETSAILLLHPSQPVTGTGSAP